MRSPWRRTGSAPCTLRLNLQPLAAPAKGGSPTVQLAASVGDAELPQELSLSPILS